MATTAKAGSRRANCPMHTHPARQRRTAAIPLAFFASGTWNGCNPNTVMSINWRASLVPAAAVIPAPRAYTNIAAVKTPVVCHRVAGPLGGLGSCGVVPVVSALSAGSVGGPPWPRGKTPSGMFLRPHLLSVRSAPAQRPLQWGPRRSRCRRQRG